jgi:hypothetical protein
VRILLGREFAKFSYKNGIVDDDLRRAIHEIESGLVDADLGGGVYKQRIRRRGGGKSGGFRTILLIRFEMAAIFIHGFRKNDKTNITAEELKIFRRVSKDLLISNEKIDLAVKEGKLIEVKYDGKKIP